MKKDYGIETIEKIYKEGVNDDNIKKLSPMQLIALKEYVTDLGDKEAYKITKQRMTFLITQAGDVEESCQV